MKTILKALRTSAWEAEVFPRPASICQDNCQDMQSDRESLDSGEGQGVFPG